MAPIFQVDQITFRWNRCLFDAKLVKTAEAVWCMLQLIYLWMNQMENFTYFYSAPPNHGENVSVVNRSIYSVIWYVRWRWFIDKILIKSQVGETPRAYSWNVEISKVWNLTKTYSKLFWWIVESNWIHIYFVWCSIDSLRWEYCWSVLYTSAHNICQPPAHRLHVMYHTMNFRRSIKYFLFIDIKKSHNRTISIYLCACQTNDSRFYGRMTCGSAEMIYRTFMRLRNMHRFTPTKVKICGAIFVILFAYLSIRRFFTLNIFVRVFWCFANLHSLLIEGSVQHLNWICFMQTQNIIIITEFVSELYSKHIEIKYSRKLYPTGFNCIGLICNCRVNNCFFCWMCMFWSPAFFVTYGFFSLLTKIRNIQLKLSQV